MQTNYKKKIWECFEICLLWSSHHSAHKEILFSLSTQTTQILIHAFATSKLDHCISLLYNVPKNVIKKLQPVQNAAARLITRSRKCDHITPILPDLHWLPVSERIKFKIRLLTFKALHQQSPTYIQDLITRYQEPLWLLPVLTFWIASVILYAQSESC